MLGVLLHVMGDALNNVGVIIAALVIWLTHYPARIYADPGVSMGIAIMILITAWPLVKQTGTILLQSAPRGVDISDVKHDLEKVRLLLSSLSSVRRLTRNTNPDPWHRVRS
jgi:zinc transporter 1